MVQLSKNRKNRKNLGDRWQINTALIDLMFLITNLQVAIN